MVMGILVDQLVKEYPGKEALKGVSFEVRDHRIHGFLGPNGAGKSTTMNIMSGLIRQTHGNVLINSLNTLKEAERCRRLVGFLPEVPPVYLDMTVGDFLEFCGRVNEVSSTELVLKINNILDRHNLGSVKDKYIGVLSKGFKQRVAIASCLVASPEILILDEPTVGLDPAAIKEIRNIILELKNDHTILVSSHQLGEISKICDDLTIIKDGEILVSDSFEAVLGKGQKQGEVFNFTVVPHENLNLVFEKFSKSIIDKSITESEVMFSLGSKVENEENEVLSELIKNQIKVLEFKRSSHDLEETFLQLISGGNKL